MDQPTESLLTADTTTAAEVDTTAPADTSAAADKPAGTTAADTPKTEGAEAEEAKADDKPVGAPETYEAFTVPEGMVLDEQMLGEFTPLLKELNLPQAAAQKLVDFAPKLIEKTAAATQAATLTALGLEGHAGWAAASKTDKEFGGEKFAENLGLANKAMKQFAPELPAVFAKNGLGNHPDVIRAFVRIGKAISEDGFVPGGTQTTPAKSFYDKSNMNP